MCKTCVCKLILNIYYELRMAKIANSMAEKMTSQGRNLSDQSETFAFIISIS